MGVVPPLLLLSADHHRVGLSDVERLSTGADAVGPALAGHPGVAGVVVLATCNRFELYVDAEGDPDAVLAAAGEAVAGASGTSPAEVARLMRRSVGTAATRHLFEVASGLDSMVVGEREITGQVRRALAAARAGGLTTPLLEATLQHATRTSRRVAVDTDLARAGRSVVSVALDLTGARLGALACERPEPESVAGPEGAELPRADLTGSRVLLLGTGSYAGATVAALRERGATDVRVWSASGRAADFAARHGTAAAAPDLAAALAGTDLVVTCRGTGTPVLDTAVVGPAAAARAAGAPPLAVVDLALHRDVDPGVADLPGVLLVDLPTVRAHAPTTTARDVELARRIVDQGVRELEELTAEREMAAAVVALRARVFDAVAAEVDRLPAGTLTTAEAAQALRRLGSRLLHEPTVRARAAGREGRGDEHLAALSAALGIDVGEPVTT